MCSAVIFDHLCLNLRHSHTGYSVFFGFVLVLKDVYTTKDL